MCEPSALSLYPDFLNSHIPPAGTQEMLPSMLGIEHVGAFYSLLLHTWPVAGVVTFKYKISEYGEWVWKMIISHGFNPDDFGFGHFSIFDWNVFVTVSVSTYIPLSWIIMSSWHLLYIFEMPSTELRSLFLSYLIIKKMLGMLSPFSLLRNWRS